MSNPFKILIVVAVVIAVAFAVVFGFVALGHATFRYPVSLGGSVSETA